MTVHSPGVAALGRRLAALVLTALLTGCSPAGQASSPARTPAQNAAQQIVTHDEMVAEYEKAVRKYPLPLRYSYPSGATVGEADSSYEVGWGALQAVDYWNCAWGREWLEYRASDKRRAERAFRIYVSVMDTEVFRTAWDRTSIQEPFKEGVQAAELGDPSALQQTISVNCLDVRKTS